MNASNDEGQLLDETLVQFERVLPGPIERAWQLLTEGEHLARWLLPGNIEPRVGGAVNLGDGHIRGVVTQWKPPRLLAYTWNVHRPGEVESPLPESYVRIELRERAGEVLLTLKHSPVLKDFEKLTLMGWHAMLEGLGSLARGREPEPRETVMERNRARYGIDAETPRRQRGE